jgi:hypothetical protein
VVSVSFGMFICEAQFLFCARHSSVLLTIRIFALYGRDWRVLWFMLGTAAVLIGISIVSDGGWSKLLFPFNGSLVVLVRPALLPGEECFWLLYWHFEGNVRAIPFFLMNRSNPGFTTSAIRKFSSNLAVIQDR